MSESQFFAFLNIHLPEYEKYIANPESYLGWTNGDTYMVRDKGAANFLADLIEFVGEYEAHTGYYDPEEDARNGETDICTGFWYVDMD